MSLGSSETPAEPDPLVPLVRRLLEAQAALADRLAQQAAGVPGGQETQVPAAHGSLETLVSAFDGLGCQVAALDASARVRAVNAGWLSFGADNGRLDGGMDVGANYLAVCENARGVDAFYAAAAASSLREVLSGHKDFATVEYACDAPAQPRWFRMMVLTVPVDGERGALVVHAYQPALTSAEPLQRALRLLANAQQVAHIGCWQFDLNSDRLHWNDATCALFGVDPQHFGGRLADFLARVEPAERPRLADLYRQFSTQAEGASRELEYRIRRDDGQQRVLHERAEEVRDANGRPLGRLGVVMDVTEQCRDREAALVQEARFRRLFARSPIPIWVYELDSLRFLAVNPAAVCQYGYSEQEFLGMTLLHVMPPEEAARLGSHLHELQSGGDVPQPTWLQQRRDGDVFTAEVHAESLHFEGRPACLVVALDITERLRAEQAREQQVLAEAAK
jgi:PAS domain S-box-containing protein